ncbi:hypothetical protein BH11ACT7_BH11ACT7_35640 [soil metagenome]
MPTRARGKAASGRLTGTPGVVLVTSDGVDLFVLAIQGWAHAQSRPGAKVPAWVAAEQFPLRWGAIGAAVIGYVVQSAFSAKELEVSDYVGGLNVLAGPHAPL